MTANAICWWQQKWHLFSMDNSFVHSYQHMLHIWKSRSSILPFLTFCIPLCASQGPHRRVNRRELNEGTKYRGVGRSTRTEGGEALGLVIKGSYYQPWDRSCKVGAERLTFRKTWRGTVRNCGHKDEEMQLGWGRRENKYPDPFLLLLSILPKSEGQRNSENTICSGQNRAEKV